MGEADVKINFIPDLTALEDAFREMASRLSTLEATAKRATATVSKANQVGAASAVAFTEAEKRAVAEVVASKAALDAKAQAANLTRGEIKRIERELSKQAAAEQAVQAATVRASEAVLAQAKALSADTAALKADAKALGVSTRQLQELRTAEEQAAQASRLRVDATQDARESLARSSAQMKVARERAEAGREAQLALANSTSKSARAFGALATQIPDVIVSLQAGQKPLTVLTQQGLQVVEQIGGLGGALTRVAGLIPPVAVAAAGLTAAYAVLRNEAEQLEEESGRTAARFVETAGEVQRYEARVKSLSKALESLRGDQVSVQRDIQELTGELTSAERQFLEAQEEVTEQYGEQILAQAQVVTSKQAQLTAIEDEIRANRRQVKEQAKLLEQRDQLRASIEAEEDALSSLKGERDDAIAQLGERAVLQEQEAMATEASTKARKASTDARREEADLLRESASLRRLELSLMTEEERAAVQLVDQLTDLNDVAARYPELADRVEAAQRRLIATFEDDEALREFEEDMENLFAATVPRSLSRSEQKVRDLQDQVAEMIPEEGLSRTETLTLLLFQMETEAARSEEAAAALADSIAAVQAELATLETTPLDELSEKFEAASEAASGVVRKLGRAVDDIGDFFTESADRAVEAVEAEYEALEDAQGVLTEQQEEERDKRIKMAEREAARAVAVGKSLATASAIAQGASAAVAALAPPPIGLGPVAGIPLAAAVGISTAASVAEINSIAPAFDVGGMVGPSSGIIGSVTPDQVTMRALPGEAVLNRQTVSALGAEGVRDLNRGRGGGSSTTVVVRYKQRDLSAVTSDAINLPGTPLNRLRQGSRRRVGQRTRTA